MEQKLRVEFDDVFAVKHHLRALLRFLLVVLPRIVESVKDPFPA